ncbi:MAG TPA: PAS domain-containing protein [Ferrovibrio sp.]|jgi:hypothetical protein|uniref:PAS domain-containing protein n=1 Tax=Ferrovibrio sp. TaxID=1917215 RepID=UPI002B4AC092|nr:PAS domain-containing protein [Ferrovibrio sp.]HLT76914.1 PAS domain-containing protein [Ferrovibrio sp.]
MDDSDRQAPEVEFTEGCWDMAALPEPLLRRAFAYWDGKRGGRDLPARADIEPTEIPDILRNIFLVDVLDDPPRFHLRLMGTAFRDWFGRELTGFTFAAGDLKGPLARYFQDWREVAGARRPRWICCRHWFDRSRGEGMAWTGLVMPMAKTEQAPVDMLFGATVFRRIET